MSTDASGGRQAAHNPEGVVDRPLDDVPAAGQAGQVHAGGVPGQCPKDVPRPWPVSSPAGSLGHHKVLLLQISTAVSQTSAKVSIGSDRR